MAQDLIEYTALRGGLDLVSSALTVAPGRGYDLHNYEPAVGGGYSRIKGYEKFSGADFSNTDRWDYLGPAYVRGTKYGTIAVDTVVGMTTGFHSASGGSGVYVAYVDSVNNVLVLGDGTYSPPSILAGETFLSGTVTVLSDVAPRVVGSTNDIEYVNRVRDAVRSEVQQVPGSGPVRGVFFSGGGDLIYAIRDNLAGTEAVAYHNFGGGTSPWTAMSNGTVVKFDNGTGSADFKSFFEYAGPAVQITGGTGGAVFEPWFVGRWSGSDGTSDAAGYMVGIFVSGTGFVDNETLKISGVTKALANGASYSYVIPPGGRYESIVHNFWGESISRTWCVNEVGAPLMFAGGGPIIPILFPSLAGAPPVGTYPKYIEVHKNHLFFGYARGNIVHTVMGDPLSVNGFLGAAEFNLGTPLTGLKSITGGGLAIYSRRKTFLLEGDDVANWTMKTIAEKSGAIDYTVQTLGQTLAIDDEGLNSLERVQAYGDFKSKPLSFDIQPALTGRVSAPLFPGYGGVEASVVGAFVVRGTNQYRLVFSDGSGVIFYLPPSGPVESTTFKYGFLPYCFSGSVYGSDGKERVFAGDTNNGWVYELNVGYSFAGENILSVARLPFNHLKSPRTRKSYRQMELETALAKVSDSDEVALTIYTETDFGSVDNDTVLALGADIGTAMNWEIVDGSNTYWTTAQEKATSVPLEGVGNNISITIVNDSDRVAPFILQGLVLRYRPRRPDRS